jgi:two-component system response regulator RegA
MSGRASGLEPSSPAAATPSLAKVVWEHIERVLADCDGNISESARRLGITRRTLQLKLKKNPPRN